MSERLWAANTFVEFDDSLNYAIGDHRGVGLALTGILSVAVLIVY
jgi:hypothetical protein